MTYICTVVQCILNTCQVKQTEYFLHCCNIYVENYDKSMSEMTHVADLKTIFFKSWNKKWHQTFLDSLHFYKNNKTKKNFGTKIARENIANPTISRSTRRVRM